MTTLTLDDEITWLRSIVDFQRRQNRTLIETGRLTQIEADRRLHLATSILGRLEQLQPNITHALANAAAAGTLDSPLASINIRCGGSFEDVAVINADLVLNAHIRPQFMAVLEQKIVAVLRHGLGRVT